MATVVCALFTHFKEELMSATIDSLSTTAQRVRELVSLVEAGDAIAAMEELYADDVEMRENLNPPMIGKAANLARERAFFGGITLHGNRAAAVLIDGDRSAINWILEFTGGDGVRYRIDQLALQEWRDGKVVRERFIYDPTTITVARG
jgi:ketosteroid isomerase-like protein